jgi:hypothetical protein
LSHFCLRYLLCLDDDILLHRGSLERLVAPLEADPHLFMATGYPFDLPAPGAGYVAYAMLVRILHVL